MSKSKVKLTPTESQVVKLNLLLRNPLPTEVYDQIKSLIHWYQTKGTFTPAQMALANGLTYVKKVKGPIKKHYLYAISNGEQVKLGMSSNIKGRMKTMQTASPSELVLLWKYYVASTPRKAVKIEKNLHRACKEWSVRGEWFSMGCMRIVKRFKPK
jgi:hypothetical protein